MWICWKEKRFSGPINIKSVNIKSFLFDIEFGRDGERKMDFLCELKILGSLNGSLISSVYHWIILVEGGWHFYFSVCNWTVRVEGG